MHLCCILSYHVMICVTVSEVYVTHLISYCTMTYTMNRILAWKRKLSFFKGHGIRKEEGERNKRRGKEEEKDVCRITWQSLLTAKMPLFFLSDNIYNAGEGIEGMRRGQWEGGKMGLLGKNAWTINDRGYRWEKMLRVLQSSSFSSTAEHRLLMPCQNIQSSFQNISSFLLSLIQRRTEC